MPRWLVVGDPHGDYSQLRAALSAGPAPTALILLGDFELTRPLDAELRACGVDFAATRVHWIAGNHDAESDAEYDYLYGSDLAGADLHARVVELDGLRVAGLAGVFRGKVWNGIDAPKHRARADFVKQVPKSQRWRDGLPRRHRVSIWPEDVERLAGQRADVLFTHEAPTAHPYGVPAIDELARSMGVRAVVHGHHHYRYFAPLGTGTDDPTVHGIALAEVVSFDPLAHL